MRVGLDINVSIVGATCTMQIVLNVFEREIVIRFDVSKQKRERRRVLIVPKIAARRKMTAERWSTYFCNSRTDRSNEAIMKQI